MGRSSAVHRFVLFVLLVVGGCGGGARRHTLELVNRTPRTITELYIYPMGSTDRGVSRGSLAPGGSLAIAVTEGAIEVLAISELIKIDDHHRDKPSASQVVDVRRPASVVFFDVGAPPREVSRPDTFGVAFTPPKPPPPTDGDGAPAP